MPAQSLVQLCGILVQIEAETKALVEKMNQINDQAVKFSVPIGWDNPENWPTKIQLEQKKEAK